MFKTALSHNNAVFSRQNPKNETVTSQQQVSNKKKPLHDATKRIHRSLSLEFLVHLEALLHLLVSVAQPNPDVEPRGSQL